jgi:hemolysin-activating ACP:hemolysin acyltransferase
MGTNLSGPKSPPRLRYRSHGESGNGPAYGKMTAVPVAPAADLKVFRPQSPYAALGLAVNHLMTKPAFANLRFGEWSRILVGQINRKHYCFAVDSNNQVQGFMGWAVTSKEKAEDWFAGRGALSFEDSLKGSCVIFNAWAASTREVNRFLLSEARKIVADKDAVYFKRYYKNGSVRPARLRVNDFVVHHLQATERRRVQSIGRSCSGEQPLVEVDSLAEV